MTTLGKIVFTALIIILFLVLGILLGACLPSAPPEPIVIERKCHMEPLRAKPKLPSVDWIEPSEGCPFYLCLDEDNAENRLKEREILLKEDSNYMRQMYNDTKARCSE